jgi:hypothetical protein
MLIRRERFPQLRAHPINPPQRTHHLTRYRLQNRRSNRMSKIRNTISILSALLPSFREHNPVDRTLEQIIRPICTLVWIPGGLRS